jgi:Tfp pilus assembly protein PilF
MILAWPAAAAKEKDDLGARLKAVEKAPTDPDSHYNLGLAYMKLERWADAEASLRRAVELNGASAQFQASFGGALAKAGKNDEAVKAYEAALVLDPSRIDVQANLGQAYLDAGKYDAAIENYKDALKNKPADPSGFYNNIGFAYLKKGDMDQAIRWFERNIETAPDSPDANYNLGQIYRKMAQETGDPKLWTKSAETLVKAADLNPKKTLGLFLAGEALIMAGQNARGVTYLDRYIAADPGGKKTSKEVYDMAVGYKAELSK